MSQAAQAGPASTALPLGVPGASITPKYQVRVRFSRRMCVQRVYQMHVELRPEKGAASNVSAGDSVIARPLVPGGHVQPPEQQLSPKTTASKVTFSVTPLAAGRLKGARLQIVHKDRVLDEIWTPMRGIRPARIVLWTALTLLSLAYLVGILGPLPDLSSGLDSALMGKLPDYLDREQLPEEAREYVSRDVLAANSQIGYNELVNVPNLNFYIVAAFLLLTLLSLFRNRPVLWQSRRKGKPMLLPSLVDGSGNALSFRR